MSRTEKVKAATQAAETSPLSRYGIGLPPIDDADMSALAEFRQSAAWAVFQKLQAHLLTLAGMNCITQPPAHQKTYFQGCYDGISVSFEKITQLAHGTPIPNLCGHGDGQTTGGNGDYEDDL